MMRSLFSGVSGLRVHQTKMDVIANNVSNVNTVGFKRSNVTFCDVFNQTLSGATAANDAAGKGGTNAKQIGLGSNVAAIATIMTTGATQRTDNGNDIMINGDGFFIVSDVTGFYFTRAGAFEVDEEGNLVDSNGLKVCGWEAEDDPDNPGQQRISRGNVHGLNLYEGSKSYVPPELTTLISFEGNLNCDTTPEKDVSLQFYDSLGNVYKVNGRFTYRKDTQDWEFTMENRASINGDPNNTIEFEASGENPVIAFDTNGLPVLTDGTLTSTLTINIDGYNATFGDPITLDFSNLTQFNASADATAETKDGYSAGGLSGFSIGSDGIITGSYTNGKTKILGQIAIANFKNPAGLEKVGNNLYSATVNSGDFDGIGIEVASIGSQLMSGALEMSNVDLSQEFTDMITTQRGFQSNSRVITTSDEMLQELVNLKR